MKLNTNKNLIMGVVFLAIGITMLMTGAVSGPIACGDFIVAFVFFGMYLRDRISSGGDKKE